jgi:hypothetical protein
MLPPVMLLQKVHVFVHRWNFLMIDVNVVHFGISSLLVYTTPGLVSLVFTQDLEVWGVRHVNGKYKNLSKESK